VTYDRPYQSLLAVPILLQQEAFGGLLLYYDLPHAFHRDDLQLAVTFADQVALAIENARLREQVEESAVAAERSRLARDLHDAVTQTLFSASVIAESLPRIWDRYPQQAQQGLKELRQLTRGALAEMRTLLLELRPVALTEKPLGELIRNLTDAAASRTRVPIALEIENDALLPPNVQVILYRIAQEALNNIAKHADATCAAVHLNASAQGVVLKVRDDGSGFDSQRIPAGHFGISIMRERAQSIGGQIQIDSALNEGTQITVVWHYPGGSIPNVRN
jgi:signal transduction histidine kinase